MRFLQDHNLRAVRVGVCLLGLLTLPLLAGCGGGGGGGGSSPTPIPTPTPIPIPTPTPTPSALTATATSASGLTASLTQASSTVAVNGSLLYTLTLTNSTANAIPVHSNGLNTPAAGLVVRNSSGLIVYAPVPGPAPVLNATLAAGQSLTTTVTANGFTAAGTYNTTATFSDDETVATTVGPLTVTAQ